MAVAVVGDGLLLSLDLRLFGSGKSFCLRNRNAISLVVLADMYTIQQAGANNN